MKSSELTLRVLGSPEEAEVTSLGAHRVVFILVSTWAGNLSGLFSPRRVTKRVIYSVHLLTGG